MALGNADFHREKYRACDLDVYGLNDHCPWVIMMVMIKLILILNITMLAFDDNFGDIWWLFSYAYIVKCNIKFRFQFITALNNYYFFNNNRHYYWHVETKLHYGIYYVLKYFTDRKSNSSSSNNIINIIFLHLNQTQIMTLSVHVDTWW